MGEDTILVMYLKILIGKTSRKSCSKLTEGCGEGVLVVQRGKASRDIVWGDCG